MQHDHGHKGDCNILLCFLHVIVMIEAVDKLCSLPCWVPLTNGNIDNDLVNCIIYIVLTIVVFMHFSVVYLDGIQTDDPPVFHKGTIAII
jgi:hypothetical protein